MAVEKSAEVMIEIQQIRRDMTKPKDIIDAIVEEGEEDPGAEVERARSEERRRRRSKRPRKEKEASEVHEEVDTDLKTSTGTDDPRIFRIWKP
jgi:hypothetical protein